LYTGAVENNKPLTLDCDIGVFQSMISVVRNAISFTVMYI